MVEFKFSQETPSLKRSASNPPVRAKRPTKRFKASYRTGRVAASKTTLSTYPTPFPRSKYVSFDYQNGLIVQTPLSNTQVVAFAPNDIFDFDRTTGFLGNKQPLYFDALLSSNGPYRYFKVLSWVTTFTIINRGAAPITLWLTNAPFASDIDTVSEVDNLPGVVKKFVDVPGGQAMVSIKMSGNIKDEYLSQLGDAALTGTYGTSPTTSVQGSLVLYSSSSLNYEIAVKHVAYTQLTLVDAIVS